MGGGTEGVVRNFILLKNQNIQNVFAVIFGNFPIFIYTPCASVLVTFRKMPPLLIAVEGNIGAGKTTVLKELESRGHRVFYENLESWKPLLDLFYETPERWSFALQVAILQDMHVGGLKARVLENERLVFFERSPQSSKIFTILSHARKYLTDIELNTYHELFGCIGWKPDVTVFIDTPPELCQKRIEERNRPGEAAISLKYLEEIDTHHRNKDLIPTVHV